MKWVDEVLDIALEKAPDARETAAAADLLPAAPPEDPDREAVTTH